ncbi:thiamine phosphate synthase [Lachnospiraceae bacterium 54-53]
MAEKDIFQNTIAVTDRHLCTRPFLEQIEAVLRLGPRALILREKDMREEEYEELARQVLPLCEAFRVPCIFHSFSQTAGKLHGDGIHFPLHRLEEEAGAGFPFTGASVHSPREAERAEELGASYVIAGHIFRTGCKPGLPPRGLDFLKEVCGAVNIPVYAIGGMELNENCLRLVQEAGAAGMCVMSGFMKEIIEKSPLDK